MDNKDMIGDSTKKNEALDAPHSIDTRNATSSNLSINIADSLENTSKENSTMSNGFIKLIRSDKVIKLIEEYPMAFTLLSIIALRATRFDCAITGLKAGEAKITAKDLVSDQCYRTAKQKLIELNFVTVRTTNRFTVAKIISSDIYDLNNDLHNSQDNSQATVKQQSGASTRIDNKKKRNKEEYKVAPLPKLSHGLHVCLTEQDYNELLTLHGKEKLDVMIEKLNQHYDDGGKKRKKHELALGALGWVNDWYEQRKAKPMKRETEQDNMIWASQFNRDENNWSIKAESEAFKANMWSDTTKALWLSYKTPGFKSQVESWLRKHNIWPVTGDKL